MYVVVKIVLFFLIGFCLVLVFFFFFLLSFEFSFLLNRCIKNMFPLLEKKREKKGEKGREGERQKIKRKRDREFNSLERRIQEWAFSLLFIVQKYTDSYKLEPRYK